MQVGGNPLTNKYTVNRKTHKADAHIVINRLCYQFYCNRWQLFQKLVSTKGFLEPLRQFEHLQIINKKMST